MKIHKDFLFFKVDKAVCVSFRVNAIGKTGVFISSALSPTTIGKIG